MNIFKKALKAASSGATLYFPGCLAKAKLPHVVEAQKAVLDDLGVTFITLDMECCGYAAAWAGYEAEFKTILDRNKRRLKEANITQIITGCPHCALIFKERYGVETKHLLEIYEEHVEHISMRRSHGANYHHPCFLDRLGVQEKSAIRILRRAGVHVPSDNPCQGCCGSVGDDFARNNAEESTRIAQRRAHAMREPLVVTSCPYCILMFQQQRKEAKDVAELLNE